MISYDTLEPIVLRRDGVRLAHVEAGPGTGQIPPLLLINGWTGDHGIFTPQIAHFAQHRRVVAVNIRGHGASDAPEQEYTIAGFADDIAWQCAQLDLIKPVVIGHSMGGRIALELCGRYPDLASGVVMIDTIVMPPPSLRDSRELSAFLEGIGGPDYLAVLTANAWDMGCDFDDPARRKTIYETYVRPSCEKTPQHVAYSMIRNATLNYDPVPAARACRIPMAYISADVPLVNMARDLDRLQEICPQLVIAKTMLAGHFNTIEVADQVNAMLDRFLSVGLRPCRRRSLE
ncbi:MULTISPECIES: alpha/beta hydrolase [unclassified Bradyrhizobium]|uniref:alpha/beta fold hydrolase n=1 Tax=unclassified Bradyrhizobium TaxID=2631580 RepID=UPI0024794248|nr:MULTISPECIES: alpha/beta hydrolase [unclassified Bradyrhizobium]WGS19121.1 alpha/beta hydrolase [Bradyrhizobium sp. ISRA463]WGS25960.1 alpha/beta hydrolase [Bradyrhizobium sp. ISRA464]